ncbi:MAG: hypothetical protein ACJ713_00380 [Candidatus Sulfotelmatobacter sp.]
MIELESMAVTMPLVEGHPNRTNFGGVLTLVDVPSQRSPQGAHGHRVVLTREVAERALPSLIGMALDYTPSFDRHDIRCKVGVITQAEVVGRNLEIGGYLYAKDFPEVVREIAKAGRKQIHQLAGTANLRGDAVEQGARLRASLAQAVAGIRELTAGIRHEHPAEKNRMVLRAQAVASGTGEGLGMSYELTDVDVVDRRARFWILTHATFTGAAILKRSKAAYQDTWIELS